MPNSAISWLPAQALLTPRRLDLIVKWRAFRALLADEPITEIYQWHIMRRTGGREPGSDWKHSLADYEQAMRELLASMNARGFDPMFHVKINGQGDLVAGAHRVACALALSLDVAVATVDKPSPSPWDAAWFIARGCAWITVRGLEEDLEDLERLLCMSASFTAA